MALQDVQLNRLSEAVVVARRRYVATGFAGVSKCVDWDGRRYIG